VSSTLTIHLDPRVLQHAEQEARRHHTTLSDIVGRQLQIMALNWQDSQAQKTPVTDALRGAVSLPHDFDERAALTVALVRKHG
jgi:hypothetical protein